MCITYNIHITSLGCRIGETVGTKDGLHMCPLCESFQQTDFDTNIFSHLGFD